MSTTLTACQLPVALLRQRLTTAYPPEPSVVPTSHSASNSAMLAQMRMLAPRAKTTLRVSKPARGVTRGGRRNEHQTRGRDPGAVSYWFRIRFPVAAPPFSSWPRAGVPSVTTPLAGGALQRTLQSRSRQAGGASRLKAPITFSNTNPNRFLFFFPPEIGKPIRAPWANQKRMRSGYSHTPQPRRTRAAAAPAPFALALVEAGHTSSQAL